MQSDKDEDKEEEQGDRSLPLMTVGILLHSDARAQADSESERASVNG